MDRGAWWVAAHRLAKSRTRLKSLNTQADFFMVQLSHWYVITGKTIVD